MIHFTCIKCQAGFQARSFGEAVDEQEEARKAGKRDSEGELLYAQFCPYCGSREIEER